ncbi:hypothetical protein E5676_scaffold606G001820 [Cucumis melo var. makuwa]|uniref:DNA-directed RNA polymerase I subunit RPA1-like n=1 Tax=Cucumis melo var. makuwa TaxID=1194695 RepID=A0A5D3C7N6_CUCMM|nr:hypothetical protein E5676_scaffold606G001820 [Cucumis melo var. makuwa]
MHLISETRAPPPPVFLLPFPDGYLLLLHSLLHPIAIPPFSSISPPFPTAPASPPSSPSSESHRSSLRLPRPSISERPLDLTHPDAAVCPSFHRVRRRPVTLRRVEAEPVVGLLQAAKHSVVERRRVINGVRIGNAYSNCGCSCLNLYYLTGKAYGGACALRICASFGSTRLICASFGSTRLMCASFGSTRLMCASFGSTRLICAFYGTTRLLYRVRAQLGTDRREAGRMREGHMDTSGFLLLPLCILSEYLVCDFELMT